MSSIDERPTERKRPARQRLPDRRLAETFNIEVGGLSYAVTIGRYAAGAMTETLLQYHDPGSQRDSNARVAAVAASLALQFGCPLDVLQRALLRDSRGRASTPLGTAIDRLLESEK